MFRLNPAIANFRLSPLGAGGLSVETPTGTVDGANVTFTVSDDPLFVVVDGLIRVEGQGYTFTGGTITVDALAPPVQYIRSFF